MVIATPLGKLSRDLVEMMIEATAKEPSAVSGQHFLEPQLYVPESF